jgi:hypothetical protein
MQAAASWLYLAEQKLSSLHNCSNNNNNGGNNHRLREGKEEEGRDRERKWIGREDII